MPDKRERDLWWAFLAGRPEADWNPPRKPTQNSYVKKSRKIGKGMRAFSDDPDSDTPEAPALHRETWHINDEGEVELASIVDPLESLPTPSGTPVPPDLPAEGDCDSPSNNQVTSDKQQDPLAWKPREPTPSLMRHINNVCI